MFRKNGSRTSPGHSRVSFPCFRVHSRTRVGLCLGQLRFLAGLYTVLRLEAVMWVWEMYLDNFGDLMRGTRSTRKSQYPWSERSDVVGIQHNGLPEANSLSWAKAVSLRDWDFATCVSRIWYLNADQVDLKEDLYPYTYVIMLLSVMHPRRKW